MKRLMTAALALAMIGGSVGAASAQPGPNGPREMRENRRDVRDARHDLRDARRDLRQDRRENRRWARGQRLPRGYYTDRRYYVNDWRARRLSAPPRGYRWVRRDNDYLLVAATTGLIASVIAASR